MPVWSVLAAQQQTIDNPVVIGQGALVLLGLVLGLVLQFMALYVALKRAISQPIERELANQGELLKQQINTLREDIKEEHNGLGMRVSPLELGARERDTRIAAIEREEVLMRERHGYMSEKIGALQANQQSANDNLNKLAVDLHETIVESGKAQTNALNALQVQFATFQTAQTTEARVRREMSDARRRQRRSAHEEDEHR